MNKTQVAQEMGLAMVKDPWLTNEISNPLEIYRANGAQGLRLAAQPITADDHFLLNYWPRLEKTAGSALAAKELLQVVISSFVDALIKRLESSSQTQTHTSKLGDQFRELV